MIRNLAELRNMIAVGESTPGPIGVNMATYVGFITGGSYGILGSILGAVVATLGLITPSVIVVLLVAMVLNSFRNNPLVQNAFYGLRPASTGLIAAAGLVVIQSNLLYMEAGWHFPGVNWKGLALAVALWLLTNIVPKVKKLHPIVFIGLAAIFGIVFSM